MLHHSACTEQMTLTVPCADAAADSATSAAAQTIFFIPDLAFQTKTAQRAGMEHSGSGTLPASRQVPLK
jgi:hypothetical protein